MNGRGAGSPRRRLRRFWTIPATTNGARSRPLTGTLHPLSGGTLIASTTPTAAATGRLAHTTTCRGQGCSQIQPRAGRSICGSQSRRNNHHWATSNAATTVMSSAKASARTASVVQPRAVSSAWSADAYRGPDPSTPTAWTLTSVLGRHDFKVAIPVGSTAALAGRLTQRVVRSCAPIARAAGGSDHFEARREPPC